MLGPAYGGAIIEMSSWRWIFWLNVPQGALLFLALLWMPNQRRRDMRVDYLGGALLAVTLLTLSLALSRQGLFSLSSPAPFLIGAPALALALVLVMLERRTLQPLLTPLLFRSRAFLTANLTQLLEGVALIIAMVTVPLTAATVMGKDPLTGAWWLMRMTAAIPVGAIAGGYLLAFVGIRPVAIAGLALSALGLFCLAPGSWTSPSRGLLSTWSRWGSGSDLTTLPL